MKKTFTEEKKDYSGYCEDDSSSDCHLSDDEVAPSDTVIKNLLNYSKSLLVFQTQNVGLVNLILN